MSGRLETMETLQKTMAVRLISVESLLKDHSSILASLQGRVEALHGLLERLDVRVGRPASA